MLELQYFRGILIVNNVVSATIALIVSQDSWQPDIFIAMGTFLLASWCMSVLVVSYTSHKIGAAKKAGYFRVPLYNSDFGVPYNDSANRPKFGAKTTVFIALADTAFAIAFLVLPIVAFISSSRLGPGVASIGAIVAFVIHTFGVLINLNYGALTMYKIKVSIVRRDQEDESALARVTGSKEQRTPADPSLHGSEPDPEPETLSPRPYRGSPSTRSQQVAESKTKAPIDLIVPTEDAALLADHD